MAEMEHIVKVPKLEDYDWLLSPGVRVGDIIFISGMTPRDDEGKMMEGTIEELTECCIRNLEKVIVHAGGSIRDFAKLTVFLKDLSGDYRAVNETLARILPDPKPARSCFQTAMNPAGARVEIEAIARAPNKL